MDALKPSPSSIDRSASRDAGASLYERLPIAARDDAGPLLCVTGLTKCYDGRLALADVAFAVKAGEVIGLIGPNGAGKTTLLEAVAGLLPVEACDLTCGGRRLPPACRHEVMFYLPDGIKPYQDQPVVRVLTFFASVYRRSDGAVAHTVASLGLAPVLSDCVRALSKGFNRRLLLALALLALPLLLMDEPFDGFDLKQVRAIGGILRREAASGRALVLAIHQLMDAEKVCDRFILLCDGRVHGTGTLDQLRARTRLPAATLEEVFLALT